MNPDKIIYCLSDIMKVNLNKNTIDQPSQEEREVTQYLSKIINFLCNRKRFEYEEETKLDFCYDQHDDEDDETEEETKLDFYYDQHHNEDDETEEDEDDVNEEHHQLSNYPVEFMQQVVDFADEKDKSGKHRRTCKSIHHRFRTLPNQGYISRFRKYLEQHGTRRQKSQELDKVVYQQLVEASL